MKVRILLDAQINFFANTIYDKIIDMYICKICNAEFEKYQQRSNHIRWTHNRHKNDTDDFRANLKKSIARSHEIRYGKVITETVKCSKFDCGNNVEITFREGNKRQQYHCSRSCANIGRVRSESQQILHKNRFNDSTDSYGEVFKTQCGNINHKKIFSSKNERVIVKHFKLNFPDSEWKSGGQLIIDDLRIVRDLWSDKLKICFEYDGIWHFKDIFNQLESKRIKDTALEDWCLANSYRLIRVDEDFYVNIQQIIDLIYNKTDPIIKIGDKYT